MNGNHLLALGFGAITVLFTAIIAGSYFSTYMTNKLIAESHDPIATSCAIYPYVNLCLIRAAKQ
jgi:hypothetical protein